MVYPISKMEQLFSPLSFVLTSFTNLIDKKIVKKSESISVDELSHALDLASDETVDEDDHKILRGIVKFGNTSVKQIMTSRIDVIAIDKQTSFDDVIKIILDSGYSRIPVFEENFDKISGVLYIKDLMPNLDQGKNFLWQNLIRPAFFVPENKKIDDLLKEFQEKKIHMAVVVDEYGGSSGVVSLEDIIEEIVGDISDEFDDEDVFYSKLDDKNYVFQGKILMNDFYRVLEIEGEEFEEEKGDSDTLAGFILEIHGKIPKRNEKIYFKNYLFVIEAADSRKITSLKLTILEEENNDKKFEE
jgi:gliding motility-associated protein GldE